MSLRTLRHIFGALTGALPPSGKSSLHPFDAGFAIGRELDGAIDAQRSRPQTTIVALLPKAAAIRRETLAATNRGAGHRASFESGLTAGAGRNLSIADVLAITKPETPR